VKLGVLGTFVWDVIYGRDARSGPVEEWGGITYAFSAFDAALPDSWEVIPIVKVGSDLAGRARSYLRSLRRLAPDAAPVEVPYANNRVELRYHSDERRSELLHGGIPGWSWIGLKPLLRGLDALYVNFISGSELDLETFQLVRQHFDGPIYCDLHSLLLATQPGGNRTPRPIARVEAWCRCADLLQVNEDEMALLAPDPLALAATALAAGVRCLSVTLGSRGVVYFATTDFSTLDRAGVARLAAQRSGAPGAGSSGPVRTARMPAAAVPAGSGRVGGDPTGCGDVWGATYYSRLLAGDTFADAMDAALAAAARNVGFLGASGLAHHLRGELSPT
jgi:hypothetical protein